MKYIDMHCDTLMKLADKIEGQNLHKNDITSVDFLRMKESNCMAEFFAIFLLSEKMFDEMGKVYIPDDEYIHKLVNVLKTSVKENEDIISMAYNANDLLKNEKEGKMSAFLTIEDGRSIDNSLEKLKGYYDLGIRLISLTWNFENCIGFPNSKDEIIMNKGLKDFGKEVIEYMNELGMIIDVSHLSDGGFWDVIEISKKPVMASHSNSRLLSPHQRNLKDDMIKALANNGGVTGLNFAPGFLDEDITSKKSTIDLMVKHLTHIRNIGGEDVVALGSDFDGIEGELEIDSSHKMPLLFDALKNAQWTDNQIEKLAYKNALRVIKESMR